MRKLFHALAATAVLGLAAPAPALAVDSSAAAPVQHLSVEDAARFGKQIERELAGKDARVAIVFRTGRPRNKLPEGIAYTHGAFWVHRAINTADGRTLKGYAVYNLYHGDGASLPTDQSYLKQDWPTDFTRGSAVDDVAVIIPSPEMQRRILTAIDSPSYAKVHNPSYSLVANPLSDKHQNCNSFMLDVIAAAAWGTDEPKQLRANLKAHYKPTPVRTNLFVRAFGPMADKRLKTDDQRGPIVTATYESMAGFMRDNGLLQEAYVLNRAS